ncbi:heme-binding domain-containing protein [uncultured Flavobacterium sp.]|uniref:heme-binding domain-containing protein n=1 Tax=uncultured Flavobacterium sp. TaxID=165435 RepID=UPI00292ECC5D|nr:heme-binding domain-containing protein [uncultured Flavobacterium sp.]
MKQFIRKILFIGLIIFLLMQFYQPVRNSDYGQVLPIHISKVYHIPRNVETILQTSCYDCHSNNTQYPWYSYIQPARLFMESHITQGKNDLNFSEWGNYSKRKQGNKLDRIVKQIKANEMPLTSYTLIHKNAVLTSAQKEQMIKWIEKVSDSISKIN